MATTRPTAPAAARTVAPASPPPPLPVRVARAQPLAVGDPAPDFTLNTVDGRTVKLASLRGRVVVIEFGSLSSPHFRRRAPAMEQLRREFDTRAQFVVVYAAEAHPDDAWPVDRNRDDDVRVTRPADEAGRRALAERARAMLKITRPLALDDLQDTVAAAYGAGQNSAYVVARDGTIAAAQRWCDPDGLRRHIEEAAAKPAK